MTLHEFLSRRSKATITGAGLALVGLLSLASHLCGPDVSLLVFYTAPVFMASWYAGRRAGYLMCAACAAFWFAAASQMHEHFPSPLVPYWNAAVSTALLALLAYLVTAFRRSLEHERELASTDFLTGALNGRSFVALAEAEIRRARRSGQHFSVAYMDVDDFKQVNDRLGHSAGDRLLRTVADAVRSNVRDVDAVARVGGDEFAVLMPQTDGHAARVAVARLRRHLLAAARTEGWPVTFSFGVVTWPTPPPSVDEMLRAADELMYAAKRRGKNGVCAEVAHEPANAA
ncbi:MAG TPA: GGDEF domain-containing protein [Pyrinomonadaceae bacterium]|nr:GGDEF domain-containing protein [Pyrinomonadaceae bacterium]